MKVYLFKKRRIGDPRSKLYTEDYFAGWNGVKPRVTSDKDKAKSFITKRSAYFYGEEHKLDWWIGAWR